NINNVTATLGAGERIFYANYLIEGFLEILLDVSAKVLPCQHTFCKPCLQRILKSHKELRCPECRTLVLSNIEELPSNLFLIRLLDGIRFGKNMMKYGSLQRSSSRDGEFIYI
uniref:RING-type domain-containing protein n=1 Tax=Laticauda laticaudata TaxID=8630 RepID=A0A8C5SGN9_LATLA